MSGDYRRHDAPDQNRPKEIWSPYARVAHLMAFGIPLLGMLAHGIYGGLAGLGTVGIIATSAPSWTRNNFIERAESRWIVRKLEGYHAKEVNRAEHEEILKKKFENPSKLERILFEAGCIVIILLILAAIVSGILNLLRVSIPIHLPNYRSGIGGFVEFMIFILPFYPLLRRFGRVQQLQMLADEPRGGIETKTLRDFATFMETWEQRYPVFIFSSLVAAIGAVLIA